MWESTPAYSIWGIVTGAIFALAFYPLARRAGLFARDYLAIGAVACVSLYLGARLMFEIVEFSHLPGRMWIPAHPLVLRIFEPAGFTFLGGLAGLAAGETALGLTPLVKPGPGRILDLLSPVCALGFATSKVGCLLAGCCTGAVTDSWFGVTARVMGTSEPARMIPVRELEMAAGLLMAGATLALVLRPLGRRALRDGAIFAGYVTAASLARFGAGFLRGDYEVTIGPLHAVQWAAMAMAVIAGASTAALCLWPHPPAGR